MTKQEYLSQVKSKLPGMPEADMHRFIEYYSEMIDDRIEDGLTEEEAVADVASPDEAVNKILEEMPLTRLVKDKITPKEGIKAWEVVLLVLGAPVWIPLLFAALVIIFALWIVVFSLLVSFYAILLSFAAVSVAGIVAFFGFLFSHNFAAALWMLGIAFLGIGVSILFIMLVKPVTKGVIGLCRICIRGIKKLFVKEK